MINLFRNIERSVYYWVKDLFSISTFITVVDSFPDSLLNLPTIAVDKEFLELNQLELGTREPGIISFDWRIDIFAENKSQRDDYAYLILQNLKNRITVYDYNYGFPPSNTPPAIGVLLPNSASFMPVKVFSELTDKMYWRGLVRFKTEYEEI